MKTILAFICIGNSCRSQMAEGFANSYGDTIFKVYSAGTYPADTVNHNAVQVMKEKGIDISMQFPKPLEDIPGDIDILITMGCEVECPDLPASYREDWGIEDPVGMPLSEFRGIRDIIEAKVLEMVKLAKVSGSKEILINKLKQRQENG